MLGHNGAVGFKVPEFQRAYNWPVRHLKRLLEDCFNGFFRLSRHGIAHSYTFLGTIILVRDNDPRSRFEGRSYLLIDGQQRITTLALLCCALSQRLRQHPLSDQSMPPHVARWLDIERTLLTKHLSECANGWIETSNSRSHFPRVVRSPLDHRSVDPKGNEFRSDVARFLDRFRRWELNPDGDFEAEMDPSSAVHQNYKYLCEQIEANLITPNFDQTKAKKDDLDCELVPRENFAHAGMRNLFEKINAIEHPSNRDQALSYLCNERESEGFVRTLLFSWYLLKCVALTCIRTNTEEDAFDIFDSLNTTGEPLTAIETFKPVVLLADRDESDPELQCAVPFNQIEEYLIAGFSEYDKRQRETKNLIVAFALYYEGKKLGLDLRLQREYLRTGFRQRKESDAAEALNFVQSLSDIAQFKKRYWDPDGIRQLEMWHPDPNNAAILKVCMLFITAMNTTMSIPLLTRYWIQFLSDNDEGAFISLVKAVTAFIALRRSVTGRTSGIDGDFREIMGDLKASNPAPLPSAKVVKSELRHFIKRPPIGASNKNSWIERVRTVPLASHSIPLCRFLLFAASHNALPSDRHQGTLKRHDVLPSKQNEFLTPYFWSGPQYKTLEHVAPNSSEHRGWRSSLYRNPDTKHTIGNLILLPQKENSSVGNAPWKKKKLFFRALAASTNAERRSHFAHAKSEGLRFKPSTIKLINQRGRLHMLDPITNVEQWTKGLVDRRGYNILQLAWDQFAPWLFE